MAEPREYKMRIPEDAAGLRLDQVLPQMFPEYSRGRLQELLKAGHIAVDGEARRGKDKVFGGEAVVLVAPPPVDLALVPQPMDLEIVWQDDSVLIVNKPPGLVVHPGAGNPDGTLVNGLLHYDPALASLPRGGLVHRLDKDTSGLLAVCRTRPAFDALTQALAERRVDRHYLALCVGPLIAGGTIDEPLGRHPVDRTRMAVVTGGRPSVTHYRVRKRFRGYTLLDVKLETGRTHQIRVHLAHRRHPLVGDPVYGRLALPRGAGEPLLEALRGFRRQALHAQTLAFAHPLSGEPVAAEAPLPSDLASLLGALEADPGQAVDT